jgi:RecB family exonuclease
MRPLSYSSISLYQQCPLLYKLRYVDNLKPKPRAPLSFGNSLHKALEFMYDIKAPPPLPLEKILTYYEQNRVKEGYESEEEEKGYLDYGKEILTEFYNKNIKDFKLPMAIEGDYIIDIGAIKLRAKIDRIDRLKDGVEIIDYKSNANPITIDKLIGSQQLAIYQMVIELKLGVRVERLTYYQLRTQLPISTERYLDERIEEVKNEILIVADKIRKEEFAARLNDYCPCDFPHLCPYFKDKYPSEKINILEDIESRGAIKEIVEEYVRMREEAKGTESRLEELKELINKYCDKNQVERVFGTEHFVTRRLIESRGFEERDVRDMLKDAGLWEKVVKFESPLVKRLLEEPSLDKNLRKELENRKKILSAYHKLYYKEIEEME